MNQDVQAKVFERVKGHLTSRLRSAYHYFAIDGPLSVFMLSPPERKKAMGVMYTRPSSSSSGSSRSSSSSSGGGFYRGGGYDHRTPKASTADSRKAVTGLYWAASVVCLLIVGVPVFLASGFWGGVGTLAISFVVVIVLSRVVSRIIQVSAALGLLVTGAVFGAVVFVGLGLVHTLVPATVQTSATVEARLATDHSLALGLSRTTLANSMVVCPYVEGNRIFLSVVGSGVGRAIEIPQGQLLSLGERLRHNFGASVAVDFQERLRERSQAIAAYLEKQIVGTAGTVVVVDGNLPNVNFQRLFPEKIVLRTSSTDRRLMAENLQRLRQSAPAKPDNTAIVNGTPKSEQELRGLGLASASWNSWSAVHEAWQRAATSQGFSVAGTAAAATIQALQEKTNVIIVVAHSDGARILFPDGSSVGTAELSQAQAKIAANHPFVALFSCETAKVDGSLASLAQKLIAAGARAVVAPTETIGAKSSATLLEAFLASSGRGLQPLEAWAESVRSTDVQTMETWIAGLASSSRWMGRC